jgi:hypothetical protein
MALRNPNNPTTDTVILGALSQVLIGSPPNTRLSVVDPSGGGANQVVIQKRGKLLEAGLIFPLVHLSSGVQSYIRVYGMGYEGSLEGILEYYDVWEPQSANSIDDVRANIAADLERVKANIEDNDSLTVAQVYHAMSTTRIQLW